MSTLGLIISFVVLFAAGSAPATPVPSVLIDYARLNPSLATDLPVDVVALSPVALADATLSWVVVRPDDSVRLELAGRADGFVRPVRFDVPHLHVYRAAVRGHEDLDLAPETLNGLRERRHEIPLSTEVGARLARHPLVRGGLPDGVAAEDLRARFVERLRAGGVRLHLSGPTFAGVVDFDDLEDFNRAGGLALSTSDFWRELLSFWRERPHAMSGGFVMKSREEASFDCGRVLADLVTPD